MPARTLLTKYADWKGSHISVVDSHDSRSLYHAKYRTMKPQITFTWDNGGSVGNATFRIDTVVGGNQITLTPQRQLKCKYTFASVAQPGFNLVWKSRKTSSEILCTDQPGIQIARLSYRNLNCTKDGRVEIFDQTGASGSALDEIVVSGIALAHMILVINLASLGAAAA